jgi:hypothetical protein
MALREKNQRCHLEKKNRMMSFGKSESSNNHKLSQQMKGTKIENKNLFYFLTFCFNTSVDLASKQFSELHKACYQKNCQMYAPMINV